MAEYEGDLELLLSTKWHVAGYRHNDPTPWPVCGAKGVEGRAWKAHVLPVDLCGNCVRICHLEQYLEPSPNAAAQGADATEGDGRG